MFHLVSSIFQRNLPENETPGEVVDAEVELEQEELEREEEVDDDDDDDYDDDEDRGDEDDVALDQDIVPQRMTTCKDVKSHSAASRKQEQEQDIQEEEEGCDLETIVDTAVQELQKLISNTPIKQCQEDDKVVRRCPSFPHVVSKTIVSELKRFGFNVWVDNSTSKISEAAQFIAFCQDRLKKKYK